ncbi:MAG TPA: hypothetical protein VET48_07970, partial [Steroidobacteraceae bacterium]|nr:hypothetical protein [Steroidobacteraceae bacterium]
TFAGTTMNHAPVSTTACSACHATGLTFVGPPTVVTEPANHIPIGSATCQTCHSATNFTTFSGTAMNHTGITSGCATCHGAGLTFAGMPPVKTLPSNHIPTGSIACETCHSPTNFTTFSGTSMNHAVVTAIACSTCHEAGKSFVGSPAVVTRPGPPHVTGGECSQCHFSTTSFKGATNMPANHIPQPASDACSLCHTNANDYSVYTMNHQGITSGCAQCHAPGLSFANIAPPALVEPSTTTPKHVPYFNVACESCHSPAQFTNFLGVTFSHSKYPPGTPCVTCHELGMSWQGIANLWVRDVKNHHPGQDCGGSGCHTISKKYASAPRAAAAAVKAPPQKTAQAVTTTTANSNTSTAPATTPSATLVGEKFDHRRTPRLACLSCHNNLRGTGKPTTHLATSDMCASCHTTIAWLPVSRVDHAQVRGACASCHNGTIASGKLSKHIVTNGACESCHTTNAWTPARFDHASLPAHTCESCHDSVHAVGKPITHIPTKQACDSCHGSLAWKPAKLDHSTLQTQCATCHNAVSATGKSSSHMTTQRDCATCHRYPDWSPLIFKHASVNYPGDHRQTLSCTSCHTSNTDQIPYASPADTGTCGACHASAFKAEAHNKTLEGLKYTESELKNCSGACHVYVDTTHPTVAKSRSGPYHRVSDASFKH